MIKELTTAEILDFLFNIEDENDNDQGQYMELSEEISNSDTD